MTARDAQRNIPLSLNWSSGHAFWQNSLFFRHFLDDGIKELKGHAKNLKYIDYVFLYFYHHYLERTNPSIDSYDHRIPPSMNGTRTSCSEAKAVPRVSKEGHPGHPAVRRDIPKVNSGNSEPQ